MSEVYPGAGQYCQGPWSQELENQGRSLRRIEGAEQLINRPRIPQLESMTSLISRPVTRAICEFMPGTARDCSVLGRAVQQGKKGALLFPLHPPPL